MGPTPLAPALTATAAWEKGSTSLAVTCAAPASAAATATRPLPVPRSSTHRPATTAGWSRTCRASACPPGQAAAQNGGSVGAVPRSTSIASHSATTSSATCRVTSGTSDGRSARVWSRTKVGGTGRSAGTRSVNPTGGPPTRRRQARWVDQTESCPAGRKPSASLTATIGRLLSLL